MIRDLNQTITVMEERDSSTFAVVNGSKHDQKEGSSCVGLGQDRLLDDQKLTPSPLHRTTCQGEENPTARTIEFLRARLLSERSVSEASRQMAQQLAQKVLELERQLEIVVEQRKNAEEATQEGLVMLENCRVAFDSGTDQDGSAFELKSFEGVSNAASLGLSSAGEEDETSSMGSGSEKTLQISDIRREEQAGHYLSHHIGRGLSWQTRGHSRSQHEKNAKRTFQSLEQMYLKKCHSGGVSESNSGSKRHIGKSCRQIKRRETRSVTEEVVAVCSDGDSEKPTESTLEDFSFSEQTESVEEFCEVYESLLEKDFEGSSLIRDQKVIYRNTLNQLAEKGEEIDLKDDQIGEQTSVEECTARVHPECSVLYSSEEQEREIESGSDKEMEMERVLEQRAELIDQYEAEENAQREWEEKFREFNCLSEQSMDCCKHGKKTTEIEEAKEQEGTSLNKSKNVVAMSNSGNKEEIGRSYQSTSERSCIRYSEKLVCCHSHEAENDIIHEMDINQYEMGHVDGSLPVLLSTTSCRLICSCGIPSSNKVKAREAEKVPVIDANFVQDILFAETLSEQEKQEAKLKSYALNFLMGLEASDKEVATTDCVTKPNDNAAENIVALYCQDIGSNLSVKTIPVFEEHIPIVAHANKLYELSAPVVHDKALDAMHTVRLPAKDAAERLPDNVLSTSEMNNIGSMAQVIELAKPCTERKTGTENYEFSGSGGLMPITGDKPQNASCGSTVMNTAQITRDSVPKECRGYSQSWHGSYNDEQGFPLMQGFYGIDTVANATCPSMHRCVSVNPMKYMSTLEVGDVQMQEQKNTREHFERTNFHGIASSSDINIRTMSQENIKGRPFYGQRDKSTGMNESKMTSMADITPGLATQNAIGASFHVPCHGFKSSGHMDRGNSYVESCIPENQFIRSPFLDSLHAMVKTIDTTPGAYENYATLKDSGTVPHRTSKRNDFSFQKHNSRLERKNCSSTHGVSSIYKDHSRGLFGDEMLIPTTGNSGCSSMREFVPSFEVHAEKSAREESHTSQINQDHYGLSGNVQPVACHRSNSSRDVLMPLQLAKFQLQNVLDNNQSVIPHLNIPASFMQERDTQEMILSFNFLEAPLSCTELFQLPSELDCKLPSHIRVSRPYLPDFNHEILMEVPYNLCGNGRVPNNLSANVSRIEMSNLHVKNNQNDVDLSRSRWPSSDNLNG